MPPRKTRTSPVSEPLPSLARAVGAPAPFPCADCGNMPLGSEYAAETGDDGFHTTGCDSWASHSHHAGYVLFPFSPGKPAPPPGSRYAPNRPESWTT